MKTEITVIIDNIPGSMLEGEWGLCLLIKFRGKKILVDAGASNLFLENMKGLGENIEDVEYAVLSHAHYDHANGMPAFFDHNTRAKLYVSEEAAEDCYKKGFLFRKYIGIPQNMMRDHADRIERISGNRMIAEGVYLIPHKKGELSAVGKREKMYRRIRHRWIPDDFSHEQSLVLDTDRGLLIVNSCSHGGVSVILEEVRSAFPGKNVYGYIGGMHLFNKTETEIMAVAEILKNADLEYICTGHCTRNRAFEILKQQLGDKLAQLQVGMKIEI